MTSNNHETKINKDLKSPSKIPSSSNHGEISHLGINADHINAARNMVKLHTRDRLPPSPNSLASIFVKPTGFGTKPSQSATFPKPNSFPVQNSNNLLLSTYSRHPNVSVPAKGHDGNCTNPQCAHCGMVIIPSPKATFPLIDKPSITINDWSIYTVKQPILSSKELDVLELRYDFPLPEMIFGNNHVKVVNDKTGSIIQFNALDALDSLNKTSDLKVSYHQEWLNARKSKSLSDTFDMSEKKSKEISNIDLSTITQVDTVKDFDWTYSPNYKGTLHNIELVPTTDSFPINRLLQPDPILFFDESILFEDELGDNGISMLSTKIRVMPTCLLLLCRFFLRVDNVIFRVRDTRIFVDFETSKVMREYKCQDCGYNEVWNKISLMNLKDPKSLMRDSNWIASNIPAQSIELESNV